MTLRILRVPSSPKGEIVGIMILVWHYGTGVVLDDNSLMWHISVQALKIIENEMPTGDTKRSCEPVGTPTKMCVHTRRCSVQKVRTPVHSLQCREAHTRGNSYVQPLVFSPSFMILWFWSVV